jgi:hypothetical protein
VPDLRRQDATVTCGEDTPAVPDQVAIARYMLEILVKAVARCMAAGRFRSGDAELVANQMWIAVHGLVTLELGGYLIEPYDADVCFDAQVCGLLTGAGDEVNAAVGSIADARERTLRGGPG